MVKRTAHWRAGFYSALLAVFLIFALSGSYPAAQEETPPVSVTEEVTQPPVTEAPTLVPTDEPTEATTEAPPEAPTEPPIVTEPPAEVTEVVTEPPVEVTEVVTEPPAEVTEVVTEPPVDVTEVVIEPPVEEYGLDNLPAPQDDTPNIIGLSSELSDLYSNWSVSPSQATSQGEILGLEFQGNQVRVMLVMLDVASAQDAEGTIASLGGVVITRYRQWIDAWLPVSVLEQAASIPNVSVIRSPINVYPIPEDTAIQNTGSQAASSSVALATPGTLTSNAPAGSSITPSAQSASIDSITRDRCVLTTVFTVTDPGRYNLKVWDDGAVLHERTYNASRNQRVVHRYTITEPVGQGAAGYGIYIYGAGGELLTYVDPYDIPTEAYLYCANGYVTRGVVASGANAWHQQGFLGSGVKVAILDSFADYTVAQARGELPPNITTYGTLSLGSRHGTAVAEIIFDMAPGVEMTFASPGNAVQMASYIEALALAGNQVISSSIGFYNAESGDGMGIIDNAVETARSYGAVYLQAAGNQANYNWQGNYRDMDSDGWHEFTGNGYELNLLNNGRPFTYSTTVRLFLRWNDWPTTSQDFNFYLYSWDGGSNLVEVAASTTVQSGSQPPVEQLTYTIPANGLYYGFAVHTSSSSGSYVLDIMGHNAPSFQYNLTDRSLIDPATSAEAVGVAAIDARSYRLESYSSRGPTLGTGGSLGSGLAQPRIAGYANVDTWSYNDYGVLFNGTSAATPHVAGAAALVFSAYPSFSPAQVISYLETNARDMGTRGYDYIYGMGRLWLGSSPRLLTPTPLSPPAMTNDNTPTFSWTAVDYADTYELQVATNSNFSNLILNATGINTTSITPLALDDGRYFWRVRAVNSGGLQGAWTRLQQFTVDTTPPDQPVLRAPRDASGTSNVYPTFSWVATRTANLYNIQIATDASFTNVIVDEETNRPSYRGVNPLGLGRYYWRAMARDAAGNWGEWSAVWSVDVTLMRSPTNGSYTLDTTPVFRWARATGAVNYELQVATDSNFSNLVIDESMTSLSYVAPVLPYDVYYWRVNVDFGSGMEISPIYWEVTITPRPPRAPRLVAPPNNTLTSSDEVVLEWQEVDDGANPVTYEVQISRVANFASLDLWGNFSGTTATTPPMEDGVWYWRVRARNYLGVEGPWSARWRFIVDTSAPDAPTLISPADGSQVANTRPPFSWLGVPGAVRYEIQLSTTNPPSETVQIGRGRTYRPTSPLLYTNYYWRVRAIDAAGNVSAWSDVFSVEIVSRANDRPVLNRYTTGSPTLSWSAITWAAGYEIQIDDAANFRSPEYSSGLIAGLSQTIPTTLPDGTWYWRVRAVDNTGRPGRWTSAGTFTVESE